MVREPELALYRSCTVVGDTTFDKEGDRTLTEALVDAIADAEGISSTDVPPLYESIDLDALAQLMDRPHDQTDGDLLIGLRIGQWNIFVSRDGRIRVCDAATETDVEPIFDEES